MRPNTCRVIEERTFFLKPTNRKLSTFKQTNGPVDSSNMMFKLIRKSIEKVYLKYNKGFYCFFFYFLGILMCRGSLISY